MIPTQSLGSTQRRVVAVVVKAGVCAGGESAMAAHHSHGDSFIVDQVALTTDTSSVRGTDQESVVSA